MEQETSKQAQKNTGTSVKERAGEKGFQN